MAKKITVEKKMPLFRNALYRPTRMPSVEVPLGARSVGHYRVGRDYMETPMQKHFVQFFWGVKGRGTLVINKREEILSPNKIALYLPGMTHHLYACDKVWEYRWWTMDGPLAMEVTSAFGFASAGIYSASEIPVALFRKLEAALRNVTPAGEVEASAAAYALLAHAAAHRRTPAMDPDILHAVALIHKGWQDPGLGVEQMARQLNIHRSQFSRRFHAAMGVAPIDYILHLRIQAALSRLRRSSQSVNEIARACGFTDPNYFSRAIRRSTGLSPRDFRGQMA